MAYRNPLIGDVSSDPQANVVHKLQGTTLTVSGLATGNALYYNGSAFVNGPLNLAGGSNYFINALPTANQVSQSLTLTGDCTSSGGTTASASTTVVALRGNAVEAQTLSSSTDGYVLTWHNASSQWQALPATGSTVSWANDLANSSGTAQYVSSLSYSSSSAGGVIAINGTGTTLSVSSLNTGFSLNQVAASSTSSGSGSAGSNLTVQAQNGQAATGSSHNGGAGANLVLTAGVGGSSGSATAGKGGVVSTVGGEALSQITITASTYSLDTNSTTSDRVILTDSTSNAITLTLPAPTAGRVLTFKDSTGQAGTNNVTVSQHASETIDGASTFVLNVPYESVSVISNGTNWFIL